LPLVGGKLNADHFFYQYSRGGKIARESWFDAIISRLVHLLVNLSVKDCVF